MALLPCFVCCIIEQINSGINGFFFVFSFLYTIFSDLFVIIKIFMAAEAFSSQPDWRNQYS